MTIFFPMFINFKKSFNSVYVQGILGTLQKMNSVRVILKCLNVNMKMQF